MIKETLNVLIHLAASDQKIGEKEAKTIQMIGKANGLTKDEVDEMMRKPMPVGNLSGLSEDQKFENLYHLIQLMKSDGHVFKSEMNFCEEIAEKLGYKRQVISELSSKIYSDPSITSDRRELMSRAHKFIVK